MGDYNRRSPGNVLSKVAATVSWAGLRELAAFRAAKGLAVSFYLNLDPTLTPTAAEAQTRVNSLLSEAARQLDRGDLTHDQRQGVRTDVERIRHYFEHELVRDGAHGLAVFAAELDNLWRPLALTESGVDRV
jgi:hypothetical protein